MTINPHLMIDPATSLRISEFLQTAMLRAVLPVHRSKVEQVANNKPVLNEPKKLGKVLAQLLAPYRTQQAGGFQTTHQISQQSVEERLIKELSEFDGLVCGIEASVASAVQGQRLKRDWMLSQSAIVYPHPSEHPSILSAAQTIQSIHTKGTVHRYTTSHSDVWMGHLESGTSDPEKFPHNRSLFLAVMRAGFEGIAFDASKDISFWDVNFDCTDRVNQKFGLPSTLRMLVDFTKKNPVQLIIPAVRVRKMRIAQRPFANNQIHKGGIEQIAESMIATCPRGKMVEALDASGLYVLSEGTIRWTRLGRDTEVLQSIEEMTWMQEDAFSSEILLDHKPIRVAIDGQHYGFHNFMDFKGDIGLMSVCWYHPDRLKEEEEAFIDFLRQL